MHDGVRPVGSPRLGASFCLASSSICRDRSRGERGQRLLDPEIRGGERIGEMQRPHREVVRGPRPDAGQRGRGGHELLEVNTVEREAVIGHRRREAMDRGRARTRQADLRDPIDTRPHDLAREREPMREACAVVRRTERRGEPAGERGRGGDRHLLPEQRADRGLEAIDRTGHAQAGPLGDERREPAILAEHTGDHVGTRIEIEHPPHARDQRHHDRHERRRDRQHERIALVGAADLDRPDLAIEMNDATICIAIDTLDAGDRPRGEKPEHAIPVVRRPVVETQRQRALADAAVRMRAPQGTGCAPHDVEEHRVEAPHALEAGGERDLGQRQRGVLEQLLREREPPGLRERDRRHAELALHRAPQVPCRHPELGRELVDGCLVQRALVDPSGRRRDEHVDRIDLCIPRRELGPAAKAGAEPGGLGERGGRVERAARPARQLRGADRAAVDARRRHTDEEHAVVAAVPRGEGRVPCVVIELHDHTGTTHPPA